MLYKMGYLAQSANICASQVEAVVPRLIKRAIDTTLALIRAELREHKERIYVHGFALDALIVRVPSTDFPVSFEIAPTTTGDVAREEVDV
uniref:Uncharacterized protein n=1 Tax=Solanum tuberosum TaxID=4113 RepID=M1DIJ5_SOLTU